MEEHIAQVVEMYRQMSLYESEPGLVIAYGSMYGNTEQMAEAVAAGAAAGVCGISAFTMPPTPIRHSYARYIQIPWIGGRQSHLYE